MPDGTSSEGSAPARGLLARSLLLNVGGNVVSLAVGFGTSIALARFLGPADRGLLGVMLSVSSMGFLIVGAGLPLAVLYYASRTEVSASALLGNSVAYALGITVLLVPAAWLAHQPVADALGDGRGGEAWVLVALVIPVTFLDWALHNQLLGELRFARFNALYVVARVASLISVMLLLGVFGLGVSGGLAANLVNSAIMIAGSAAPVLARGRPRLDAPLFRRLFRYGVRAQAGSLFQLANVRLDVVILQFFVPLKDVGYYVVAQTIAELVLTVGASFQSSVLPLVARYTGAPEQSETTTASVRHYGIVAAAAVVANLGIGTLVILFAYGEEFHPALAPMLVLLPAVWFLGLAIVIQADLGGRERPGLASALAGGAALITVAFDLLLIPPLGVMGAALASVIAYTCLGVASLWALRSVSGLTVRALIVPSRADLAVYPRALRALPARLRALRGGAA